MVITTPSGYKVTVKDFITFGQRRELERILISASKVNPQTQTMGEISPSALYDVQDKAVEMLVTQIEKGHEQQIIASGFVSEIASWKEEDGAVVYAKINEITTPKSQEGKKK